MTAIVNDFTAIGKTLSERPAEKNLATLWWKLDEMTDLLVDGDGELSEEEWDRLSAQALELEKQIVTSPAISLDDVWGKFKLLESVMANNPDPDHNALRADISSALQSLAANSDPQQMAAGNSEISVFFREWLDLYRRLNAEEFVEESEEWKAMLQRPVDIEQELIGTKARTLRDFAMKAFLAWYRADAGAEMDLVESLKDDAVRLLGGLESAYASLAEVQP